MRCDERVGGCSFSVVLRRGLLVDACERGGRGKKGGVREVGELGLGCIPDLDGVGVVADEVFQVDCQGAAVALEAGAGGVDALRDVEDDRGEAVFVDVNFLVVGDLADGAGAGVSIPYAMQVKRSCIKVLRQCTGKSAP